MSLLLFLVFGHLIPEMFSACRGSENFSRVDHYSVHSSIQYLPVQSMLSPHIQPQPPLSLYTLLSTQPLLPNPKTRQQRPNHNPNTNTKSITRSPLITPPHQLPHTRFQPLYII